MPGSLRRVFWVPTHWWGFHLPSGRYCSGPACVYRHSLRGGPPPRFRPQAFTTGSTTIPAGLIMHEAEDPGGHRAQRLQTGEGFLSNFVIRIATYFLASSDVNRAHADHVLGNRTLRGQSGATGIGRSLPSRFSFIGHCVQRPCIIQRPQTFTIAVARHPSSTATPLSNFPSFQAGTREQYR